MRWNHGYGSKTVGPDTVKAVIVAVNIAGRTGNEA